DIAELSDAVAESDHRERRRSAEAEPGGESAGQAGAQNADGDAGLARRRAGKKLAERDDVGVGGFVEPLSPRHELGAEIAEMRDRPAEARQPEAEEGKEDRKPRVAMCRLGGHGGGHL